MSPLLRLVPALAWALLTSACATSTSQAPLPVEGKPQAPVEVQAELASHGARVTVRFLADVAAAKVEFHGAEGLVVTSPTGEQAIETAARGTERTFEITYTPGPGASLLAVGVTGDFSGAHRRRVVSFTVGSGAGPGAAPGTRTINSNPSSPV